MSFSSRAMSLFALLDMAPPSPTMHDSDESRECSPLAFDPFNLSESKAAATQASLLLKLPDDIFKCVMDYLDRDAAWSLKRLCKGMARSETVNQLLYKYPIQVNDVRDIRLADWKYRSIGEVRWLSLKDSINDSNRNYVHKLAMSHWASIEDFEWIQENLPSLTALDISPIKDFVWTPEETWTWKMLAEACPRLLERLEELEVANWADYTAHSRIEYSYSYNDYRFKQNFRLSRRRDGGSVANMIFPLCRHLKALAIRERYSGFHTWNEWEVHQRVCCLVDGIQKYCSSSLTKLRVHDYAPYRSLFSTDATAWSRLTDVEIGLYSWMEDRRDRDVIGPIPYRIAQGHHHREEEEAFDDKTFDTCERDHMVLGNHVVQGVGASFEDLLQSLQTISNRYPNINIRPIRNLENITLAPFHLVNVMRRRHHLGQPFLHNNDAANSDPSSKPEVQEALRWLSQKCAWKPILAWDSLMCDVFPANLEPSRTLLPKHDVLKRIQLMISTLRSLKIPVRISIGDRTNPCPSSGLDGSLYFGDYKAHIGEGSNKHEVLLPTQASFCLMYIAPLIDELTIQYPLDVPGVSRWHRAVKRASPAENLLMHREKLGWRRFWHRYAPHLINLKKLTANVPNEIYDDWGYSDLPQLLHDERWQMLEVEDSGTEYGFIGSYFPFSAGSRLGHTLSRKRARARFVQRVFFRLDAEALPLCGTVQGNEKEMEESKITEDMIRDREGETHRFWVTEEDRTKGKRKRCVDVDVDGMNEKQAGDAAEKGKRQKVITEVVE
ncbi:hypothetical protein ACN47E_009784 [Coniothyrium glycines]